MKYEIIGGWEKHCDLNGTIKFSRCRGSLGGTIFQRGKQTPEMDTMNRAVDSSEEHNWGRPNWTAICFLETWTG